MVQRLLDESAVADGDSESGEFSLRARGAIAAAESRSIRPGGRRNGCELVTESNATTRVPGVWRFVSGRLLPPAPDSAPPPPPPPLDRGGEPPAEPALQSACCEEFWCDPAVLFVGRAGASLSASADESLWSLDDELLARMEAREDAEGGADAFNDDTFGESGEWDLELSWRCFERVRVEDGEDAGNEERDEVDESKSTARHGKIKMCGSSQAIADAALAAGLAPWPRFAGRSVRGRGACYKAYVPFGGGSGEEVGY